MRHTQLYLDDQLWSALHARAPSQRTFISELVREAVRERYLGNQAHRTKATLEVIGIRKPRSEERDSTEQIRSLRRGTRVDRLHES